MSTTDRIGFTPQETPGTRCAIRSIYRDVRTVRDVAGARAAVAQLIARPMSPAVDRLGRSWDAEPIPPTATCSECGRRFNLLDLDDADEWTHGHDCEDPT
jgi:hypothetical protein